MSKASAKTQSPGASVADQVAEFIGRTMGELLNKKDTLAKQMAEVDGQIADIKARVVKQFGGVTPARRITRARKAVAKAAGRATRRARVVSEETRAKMADAARRRWARERTKKR